MEIAYIAGPYRAENPRQIVLNIRRAEAVALSVWKMGYVSICPHMNTRLFDGELPDETALAGDLEIIRRCDLIVLVDGWPRSSGTRDECRLAYSIHIPVFEWVSDTEIRPLLEQRFLDLCK